MSAESAVLERLRRKEKELRAEADLIKADLDVIEGLGNEDNGPVHAADFLRETGAFTWAVGGLIASGTVTMITADPSIGKTTFLTQLTASMALGVECLGLPVPQQLRVLYCLAEGSRHAYRERFRKVCETLKFDPEALSWYIQPSNQVEFELRSPAIARLFRAAKAEVIVLDTLGYFHGGDENDAQEWKERVMKPLRSFVTELGCCFILVHHHGKGSDSRFGANKGRGSSAMHGDVDHWLRLEKVPLSKDEKELPVAEQLLLTERRRELFIDKNKYGRTDSGGRMELDAENGLFRRVAGF